MLLSDKLSKMVRKERSMDVIVATHIMEVSDINIPPELVIKLVTNWGSSSGMSVQFMVV